MKNFLKLCLTASLLLTASISYSQSLGDLAKKEKQRREGIQNDKVITAEEAAKFKSEPDTPQSTHPQLPDIKTEQKSKEEAVAANPPSKADPDESVDFQGKTESYWRKTMAEARQKITDLENAANVIALKLNDFQNQINAASDSFKRETAQREFQKCLYEQDLNKENLAKAQENLQNLDNEAKKSGALPGWIEDPKR
jgi:hypothetical protein